MATARSAQVDLGVTPYYHCMSRCVRRAFLCGQDSYSGQNYEHRKAWVRGRIRFLAKLFAIDVCAYAVMSNHLHIIVHVDQARAESWTEGQLVERYTRLYPMAKAAYDARSSADERKVVLDTWRERLCDISWMMRALNEFIARKANKEDSVRGRFWEGRFKSQALVDEEGLLTCMAYVDLNPVRSGLASTLEDSDFTSIQERLQDLAKKRGQKRKQSAPETLAAFVDQASSEPDACALPIKFEDYVELVRWSGRALARGKRGKLVEERPTLLRERGLSGEGWLQALRDHRVGAATFLGSAESLGALAEAQSKSWVRGIGLARAMAA